MHYQWTLPTHHITYQYVCRGSYTSFRAGTYSQKFFDLFFVMALSLGGLSHAYLTKNSTGIVGLLLKSQRGAANAPLRPPPLSPFHMYLSTGTTMVASEGEGELRTAGLTHGDTLIRHHNGCLRAKQRAGLVH